MRIFNILLAITVVGIWISCGPRWTAFPQNIEEFEKCRPLNSNPQMIIIPGFEGSSIIIDRGSCHIMNRERVSIGLTIFLEEWNKSFPSRQNSKLVSEAVNNLMIEFSSENKVSNNVYSTSGEKIFRASLNGLMISPRIMWVKARPGERLCHTSFAHELIHAGIWAIKKTDGDPDHLGKKYTGWSQKHMLVMQKVNERLCELGI